MALRALSSRTHQQRPLALPQKHETHETAFSEEPGFRDFVISWPASASMKLRPAPIRTIFGERAG
jgi:hypothetical protein